MKTCGVWLSRRYLFIAIVNPAGKLIQSWRADRTPKGRMGLLSSLEADDAKQHLVLTDAHARLDEVAELAVRNDFPVLLAPWRLCEELRVVAGARTGAQTRTALLLARMPISPYFRTQLRHTTRDPQQLFMFGKD